MIKSSSQELDTFAFELDLRHITTKRLAASML